MDWKRVGAGVVGLWVLGSAACYALPSLWQAAGTQTTSVACSDIAASMNDARKWPVYLQWELHGDPTVKWTLVSSTRAEWEGARMGRGALTLSAPDESHVTFTFTPEAGVGWEGQASLVTPQEGAGCSVGWALQGGFGPWPYARLFSKAASEAASSQVRGTLDRMRIQLEAAERKATKARAAAAAAAADDAATAAAIAELNAGLEPSDVQEPSE